MNGSMAGWDRNSAALHGKDRKTGTVTYIGDQIKFQNGFGAWIQHTYQCEF